MASPWSHAAKQGWEIQVSQETARAFMFLSTRAAIILASIFQVSRAETFAASQANGVGATAPCLARKIPIGTAPWLTGDSKNGPSKSILRKLVAATRSGMSAATARI